MKKYLVLILLISAFNGFSQNTGMGVHYGCYGNNDSLTMAAVKKTKSLQVLGNQAVSANVKTWVLTMYLKNAKSYIFKPEKGSALITARMKDELLGNWKKVEKVMIQEITISSLNKKTGKYEDVPMDPVTFYLNDKAVKKCDEKTTQAKDDLILKFSCFKTGDVASIKDLLHYPSFTIINSNTSVDVKILSYNYLVPKMDMKRNPKGLNSIPNADFMLNDQSFDLAKKLLPGESFVLDDITVEFSNRKSKTKETIIVDPIVVVIGQKSGTQCGEEGSDSLLVLEYSGKLLTGKEKNLPLVNQKVFLKDQKDTVVQTTTTNSYGDFTFKNLSASESYKINVVPDDKTKIKDQQMYLAKVDGTIVKSLERNGNTFAYDLLPPELHTLAQEKVEDTELKIRNFGTSSALELTVIEDIYYAPNSAEITEESQAGLDKIINAMKQNPALKLAISSHTDANGDDAYNMTLSDKRAKKVLEFFLGKGVARERLSGKGFGETQIKNRCKNKVDCSELEHELNRRTEFKFTK
ncbi:MAG: OmpA family protein [Bacteroidota bacterium]|nr:OmpA family protein [Bacteroidota bacterium]